jgi:hypothetical protein
MACSQVVIVLPSARWPHDAALGRHGDVHVVPDPRPAHDLQFFAGPQHLGRHLTARSNDQGVVLADLGHQLLGRNIGFVSYFIQNAILEDLDPILRQRIAYQYLCHASPAPSLCATGSACGFLSCKSCKIRTPHAPLFALGTTPPPANR